MKTIKSSSEISNIFSNGTKHSTPSVVFIVLKRSDRTSKSSGRVAFIAGKKLGCAVWRNGAKRRLREICNKMDDQFYGLDVVLVAKHNILDRDFWKIVDECKRVKVKFYR